MNLEHLFTLIRQNFSKLKNKKKTILYFKYQLYVLWIKKQKLKLGKVALDIHEFQALGITIGYYVEMRYVNQDTSKDDEMRLDNRLKALNWKWDINNILAFLIVFFLASLFFAACLYTWYCNNLPAFAYRALKYDNLVKNSLKFFLNETDFLSFLRVYFNLNSFFFDIILDMIIHLRFFF